MAQKGPAPVLVGHGDHHRQGAALLDSQQGGPALLEVGHGFNQDQVRPGLIPGEDHLLEDVYRLLKPQGARGLQKLADGADI